MDSQNNGNNRGICACLGISRDCVLYTSVVTFATLIFIASMVLTVYFTHVASLDKALVVLIVGSCLLYLSSFCGNMYSIYYCRPNFDPPGNREHSLRSSHSIGSSSQNTSTNARAPDLINFQHTREHFGITPPPPYEVQMSEMSRMLLTGTSRRTGTSAREAEIAEEARKLIRRMYEGMTRTDQLDPQPSTDEQPVMTPKTPKVQKKTMSPLVSNQNLVVQTQQTVAKSSPGHGMQPAGFRTYQVQGNMAQSSLQTQLDLGRLLVGSEGCSAVNPQSSSRIPGRPPVDFRNKQVIKQKVTPNSPPSQPDLERFAVGGNGCVAASPQLSSREEGALKPARKRKLTNPKQQLQARPNSKGNVMRVEDIPNRTKNNEYEEIELVESAHSMNSSQVVYDLLESYCIESKSEDPSAMSSSTASGTSEPSQEERKKVFLTPNVKEPLQLSPLATKQFLQLGASPETVLNAIEACPELDGDLWMAAWNLSLKNVPPVDRARILGLRLQEESYNADS